MGPYGLGRKAHRIGSEHSFREPSHDPLELPSQAPGARHPVQYLDRAHEDRRVRLGLGELGTGHDAPLRGIRNAEGFRAQSNRCLRDEVQGLSTFSVLGR